MALIHTNHLLLLSRSGMKPYEFLDLYRALIAASDYLVKTIIRHNFRATLVAKLGLRSLTNKVLGVFDKHAEEKLSNLKKQLCGKSKSTECTEIPATTYTLALNDICNSYRDPEGFHNRVLGHFCNATNLTTSINKSIIPTLWVASRLCEATASTPPSLPIPVALLQLFDKWANEVRTMILTHYFRNADAVGRVFAEVDVTLMPSAIEWIGRDATGYSAMFHLVRGNHVLLLSSVKEMNSMMSYGWKFW